MVTSMSKKRVNQATNIQGCDKRTETSQWEAIQIPLWLLREVITKDFDMPLTGRQLDNKKNTTITNSFMAI